MNTDQINSIVRTLLKIGGAILIKHGLSDYAAVLNTPDVVGLVVLLIGLWMSHQTHADPLLKAIKEFSAGPQLGRGGDSLSPLPPISQTSGDKLSPPPPALPNNPSIQQSTNPQP